MPLQTLRSPLDPARFLFSSLSSLHVLLEYSFTDSESELQLRCLRDVVQLPTADADCCSSLRRLLIDHRGGWMTKRLERLSLL